MTDENHQPGTAKHGDFRPGYGYYDSTSRHWIKDPAKLTEIAPAPQISQGQRDEFERMQSRNRGEFQVNPEKEAMIRLRDSDRQEDREKFNKMFSGVQRTALARYEEDKRNS